MMIAVIGASGHIGNNLCRALVEKGYRVKALIHHHSHSLEGLDLIQEKGDILDPHCLCDFLTGCDVVFHAAGKISIDGDKDGSVHTVNVIGTKNIVEACLASGIHKLIYFSSIHAIEQLPEGPLDESRPLVQSSRLEHDQAKSDAEREVVKGIAQGLDTTIIIPTAAIGPYDFQPSFLGQGLLALYNRQLPTLVDGGFDWVDVRDIAKAAIAAMERGKSGERYVISGMWKTVKDLAYLVEEATGVVPPKFTSPQWLAKMGMPLAKVVSKFTQRPLLYTYETLEVLVRCNRNISSLKARRELGFYPRPLSETLKDTFEWYRQAGVIS